MDLTVGQITEGKVTGLAKFGAFVSLGGGKSGLVHISEISNGFIEDISTVLSVGQEVKVKIINIDNNGRLTLSIKQVEISETSETPKTEKIKPKNSAVENANFVKTKPSNEEMSFDDKLKHFMQMSESKISDLNRHADRKNGRRKK